MQRKEAITTTEYHSSKHEGSVSKVSEIFDLASKITPIKATMKLYLHTLGKRGLDCQYDARNWQD